MSSKPTISVFGSSAPAEGDPGYERARDGGRRLAEAGCRVQTGGYAGTMAATSRGAFDAGGHVIGVTSDAIETYRPSAAPNEWVHQEVRHATLRERLAYLIESCDGVVVLPGGVGTLAELALTWNLVLVGEVAPRPIVCVGDRWAATLDAFRHADHVPAEIAELVNVASDAPSAVGHLMGCLR